MYQEGRDRPGFESRPGQRSDAQHQVREVAKEARTTASEVVEQAKQTGKEAVAGQKRAAAGLVSDIAQAVHSTAQQLDQKQPGAARWAHQAAERLDQVSHRLQNRSVDDIASEITQAARRNPGIFLGGAVLAGFLLARFLKASGERSERERLEARGFRSTQAGMTWDEASGGYEGGM